MCTAEEDDEELMVELVDVDAREGAGLGVLNGGTGGMCRFRVEGTTLSGAHIVCIIASKLYSWSLISCPSAWMVDRMVRKSGRMSSFLAVEM
jgi:hypothetical protein